MHVLILESICQLSASRKTIKKSFYSSKILLTSFFLPNAGKNIFDNQKVFLLILKVISNITCISNLKIWTIARTFEKKIIIKPWSLVASLVESKRSYIIYQYSWCIYESNMHDEIYDQILMPKYE